MKSGRFMKGIIILVVASAIIISLSGCELLMDTLGLNSSSASSITSSAVSSVISATSSSLHSASSTIASSSSIVTTSSSIVTTSSSVSSGLVAYYPFDGNTNDVSGNGFSPYQGSPVYTADRFNNVNSALSLSTSHSLDIAHNPLLNPADMTLSFWVKTTGTGTHCVLAKTADYESGYSVLISNGKLVFVMGEIKGGSNEIVSTSDVNTGNWVYITCLKTGGTMKLYINGTQEATGTTSYNCSTTQYLNIGSRYGGTLDYTGYLDDLRIYSYGLSTTEIGTLYHAGGWDMTSSTPSLMAYYPFTGNANDASGNGHNGVIISNVSLTSDRLGNANSAYYFQNNGCIEIPDSPDLRITPTSQMTIMFWVKADSDVTNPTFVITKGDYVNREYSFCQFTGGMNSYFYGQVFYNGTQDMHVDDWTVDLASGWHFITMTKNAKAYSLFIDGNFMNSNNWVGTDFQTTDPLWIGYPGFFDGFKGKIDDIRIFSGVLSSAEISNYYIN